MGGGWGIWKGEEDGEGWGEGRGWGIGEGEEDGEGWGEVWSEKRVGEGVKSKGVGREEKEGRVRGEGNRQVKGTV